MLGSVSLAESDETTQASRDDDEQQD